MLETAFATIHTQENQEPSRKVIIQEVALLQAKDQRRVVILSEVLNPEEDNLHKDKPQRAVINQEKKKIEIIKEKEADPEPIQEQTEEEVFKFWDKNSTKSKAIEKKIIFIY